MEGGPPALFLDLLRNLGSLGSQNGTPSLSTTSEPRASTLSIPPAEENDSSSRVDEMIIDGSNDPKGEDDDEDTQPMEEEEVTYREVVAGVASSDEEDEEEQTVVDTQHVPQSAALVVTETSETPGDGAHLVVEDRQKRKREVLQAEDAKEDKGQEVLRTKKRRFLSQELEEEEVKLLRGEELPVDTPQEEEATQYAPPAPKKPVPKVEWPCRLGTLFCQVVLKKQTAPKRKMYSITPNKDDEEAERVLKAGEALSLKASTVTTSNYISVHLIPSSFFIGSLPNKESAFLAPLLREGRIAVKTKVIEDTKVTEQEVPCVMKIKLTEKNLEEHFLRALEEENPKKKDEKEAAKAGAAGRGRGRGRGKVVEEPEKKKVSKSKVSLEDFPLGKLIKALPSDDKEGRKGMASEGLAGADWFEKATELVDKLYENQAEMKEMEPDEALCSNLRPYQKRALWWMMQRENAADKKESKKEQEQEKEKERENEKETENVDNASSSSFADMNPLYEQFYFMGRKKHDGVALPFYYNKYTGKISLARPPPPSRCRGGILADDMGLGKTVETLSLIVTNNPDVAEEITPREAMGDLVPSRATLIVCPLSVLHQWNAEIEKHTPPNYFSVCKYYGNERIKDAKALSKYDVVLTTYSTLGTEYVRSQKEHKQYKKGAKCTLMHIHWFRIVLDEAHLIRDRKTNMAKSCCALRADRKWCLSATPIQNKLDDIFSLLQFLELDPFGDLAWWNEMIKKPYEEHDKNSIRLLQSILRPLFLRRTKTQTIDGVKIVDLPPRVVDTQVLEFESSEMEFYTALYQQSRVKFQMLQKTQTINHNFANVLSMLLRLRQTCDHPLLVLSSVVKEKDKTYGDLNWWVEMKRFVHSRTEFKEESPVLEWARERKKKIMDKEKEKEKEKETENENEKEKEDENGGVEDDENELQCPVCQEVVENGVITHCQHIMCKECIETCLVSHKVHRRDEEGDTEEGTAAGGEEKVEGGGEAKTVTNGRCPVCKEPIEEEELKPWISPTSNQNRLAILGNSEATASESVSSVKEDENEAAEKERFRTQMWEQSTKIKALLIALKKIHREEPGTKSVVFSQWTSMLDIVQKALKKHGIHSGRLDGTMTTEDRQRVIKAFYNVPQMTVFLVSLKAGGLGLNLVCANKVFMLDPWWNPATEDQAIDRVHRIGQKKPVHVVRYVIKNTVEEKILKLQERKSTLANCTLGLTPEQQKKKLMESRLNALFSMTEGGNECTVCYVEFKDKRNLTKCNCDAMVCKDCRTECQECNRLMCEHCYVLCAICHCVFCDDCFYETVKQETNTVCLRCLKDEREREKVLSHMKEKLNKHKQRKNV